MKKDNFLELKCMIQVIGYFIFPYVLAYYYYTTDSWDHPKKYKPYVTLLLCFTSTVSMFLSYIDYKNTNTQLGEVFILPGICNIFLLILIACLVLLVCINYIFFTNLMKKEK